MEAYLERIGLTRAGLGPLDEVGLRRLAAAHAATVPFENTRAHRGERISVRIEDVLERLVERREGGVCYELNGGLGWLLTELGARVQLIAAQVLTGAEAPGTSVSGLPMSHMALVVALPDRPGELLVDVGFGGDTILRSAPVDGETIVTSRGSSYRVDTRPRELPDFEGVAWWHSTSPGSRFMRGIIVSSTRADGVTTLSGRGDDALEWRFRGERDAEARDVGRDEAQAIAGEVFGLHTPLPQRVLRYGPLDR
ncbi:MAG TPA: arylamine N-acetyltransferase [Microbacteriaceae bacterium]|nr:arylamine N-acetyltransferase [Microbacteriaceae bacterium]